MPIPNDPPGAQPLPPPAEDDLATWLIGMFVFFFIALGAWCAYVAYFMPMPMPREITIVPQAFESSRVSNELRSIYSNINLWTQTAFHLGGLNLVLILIGFIGPVCLSQLSPVPKNRGPYCILGLVIGLPAFVFSHFDLQALHDRSARAAQNLHFATDAFEDSVNKDGLTNAQFAELFSELRRSKQESTRLQSGLDEKPKEKLPDHTAGGAAASPPPPSATPVITPATTPSAIPTSSPSNSATNESGAVEEANAPLPSTESSTSALPTSEVAPTP